MTAVTIRIVSNEGRLSTTKALLWKKLNESFGQPNRYILKNIFFPLWLISGDWIQFPVPYSRTLLFTHSE